MVIGITILYRLPFDNAHYNFNLFWSYKKAKDSGILFLEIMLNYLMLLPFGIMVSLYVKRRWVALSGFLFSVAIEISQFFLHRGLFEFDDIIGNCFGVLIGMGVYQLIVVGYSIRMKNGKT